MYQHDILPSHSPNLQHSSPSKRSPSPVKRKSSGPTIVGDSPTQALKHENGGSPQISRNKVTDEFRNQLNDEFRSTKISDDISYTLRSTVNSKPNRLFTITPVKIGEENDSTAGKSLNKEISKRPIRRTASGLPTVNNPGHSVGNNNTNELKVNKLFLRNDTSPVIIKTSGNVTKPNLDRNGTSLSRGDIKDSFKEAFGPLTTKEALTKSLSSGPLTVKEALTKSLSNGLTRSPNGIVESTTTGNVRQTSLLGRSNTESKLTRPSPLQGSSVVFHPPVTRSMTQDSFNELLKNNFHTMPAGATQFFIRSPPGAMAGDNLVRANTETSLVDDLSCDGLSSNTNSLNRNSGMRVLGYIWTFWNKGQSPAAASQINTAPNGVIRIPPGRIMISIV
ncbi:hypothetical protein WDU94_011219 [Cyamophila willieti]